eukprot:8660389-Pyramimonas_sp.AAC.1
MIGGSGAQQRRRRTPPARASALLLPPLKQRVPRGKGKLMAPRPLFQMTRGRVAQCAMDYYVSSSPGIPILVQTRDGIPTFSLGAHVASDTTPS